MNKMYTHESEFNSAIFTDAKNSVFDKIIDFDFKSLYPNIFTFKIGYRKYLKRIRNRQKLYEKLKRKGRKL